MNDLNLRTMQQSICGQGSVAMQPESIFPTVGCSHSFFNQEKMSISVANQTTPKAVPTVSGHTTVQQAR